MTVLQNFQWEDAANLHRFPLCWPIFCNAFFL